METLGIFNTKKCYLNDYLYDSYTKHFFKGDGGVLKKEEHIYKEKYSYTHKKEAEHLSLFIKKIINNDIENALIVDGTTSLGGNLISFIHHFKCIIGIEINSIRFHKLLYFLNTKLFLDLIKKNNNMYNSSAKDIVLINDSFNNYIEFISNIKKKIKIIYLDPPWGGKNYKDYNNIILGLAGVPLNKLVQQIKKLDNKIIIILKLPLNYFLKSFSNKINNCIKLEKFFYVQF
jgi:hypothetical protein